MAKYSYTQSSFTGGIWSKSLWHRVGHNLYPSSCRDAQNFYSNLQGTLKKRTGLKFSTKIKNYTDTEYSARLVTFKYTEGSAYILEFGENYIRIHSVDGLVYDGSSPFEITTTFSVDDLRELVFSQNQNKLYINHKLYDDQILTFSGSSDTDWALSTPTYGAGIEPPTNLVSSGGTTYSLRVSSVKSDDTESVPTTTIVTADLSSTLTWDAVTNADRYYIYQLHSGMWQSIGISGTNSWTYPSVATTPDSDKGIVGEYDYFSGTGNHPTCSTFFQQRRWSGGTINNPKRIHASVTGNGLSYNSQNPHTDSDAIVGDIYDSDYNNIKFLVPINKTLYALGEEGVYTVDSGSTTSKAITATQIDIGIQTYTSCGFVAPALVDATILFYDNPRTDLQQYSYSLQDDSMIPSSLTVLAKDLFENCAAVEASFKRNEIPSLYTITDDGQCYQFVYSKPNQIYGWWKIVTDGFFESVAVMPRTGQKDRVYFIVKRDGGQYVEYLEDEDNTDETTGFYVDSGVTKSSTTAFTIVDGLDHLDGKTVVALGDGVVYTGLTVASGQITLPYSCNIAHVGLSYDTLLRTINPVPSQTDSLLNKMGSIVGATIRCLNTRQLQTGKTSDDMYDFVLRGSDDGKATDLYSGDATVTLPGGNEIDSDMWVGNTDPVPLNIQGITYYVEKNGV